MRFAMQPSSINKPFIVSDNNNYYEKKVIVGLKKQNNQVKAVFRDFQASASHEIEKQAKNKLPVLDTAATEEKKVYPGLIRYDRATNQPVQAILSKEISSQLSSDEFRTINFFDKTDGSKKLLPIGSFEIGTLTEEQESHIIKAFQKYLEEYRAVKLQIAEDKRKASDDEERRNERKGEARRPENVADHIRGRLEKQEAARAARVAKESREHDVVHEQRLGQQAASKDKGAKIDEKRKLEKEQEERHQRIEREARESDEQRSETSKSSRNASEGLPPEPKKVKNQ